MRFNIKTVVFEKLQPRDKIVVQTENRTYVVVVTDPENRMATVQDEKRFPEGTDSFIQGFELGYGLRFIPREHHGGIVTSSIRFIRLNDESIGKVI